MGGSLPLPPTSHTNLPATDGRGDPSWLAVHSVSPAGEREVEEWNFPVDDAGEHLPGVAVDGLEEADLDLGAMPVLLRGNRRRARGRGRRHSGHVGVGGSGWNNVPVLSPQVGQSVQGLLRELELQEARWERQDQMHREAHKQGILARLHRMHRREEVSTWIPEASASEADLVTQELPLPPSSHTMLDAGPDGVLGLQRAGVVLQQGTPAEEIDRFGDLSDAIQTSLSSLEPLAVLSADTSSSTHGDSVRSSASGVGNSRVSHSSPGTTSGSKDVVASSSVPAVPSTSPSEPTRPSEMHATTRGWCVLPLGYRDPPS